MKLRAENMIAIDFGSRSIKLVEGSLKNGNLNIRNNIFIDLPDGIYENGYIKDEDILIEIVDSALSLNNIKRRDTLAVVSSSDILTRNISLPSVKPDEIEGIIKYKISDYIPIDLKDYVVQYINQGSIMEDGNKKVKLFIIAMPREIIDIHFNFLKELGLKPKVLDFQSNCIRKLLLFNEKNKSNNNIERSNIASIDIGFFSTKLTILKNGNIELSRTIILGIKDIFKDIKINLTENEMLERLLNLKDIDEDTCQISIALEEFLVKLFENLNMIIKYYDSLNPDNNIDLIFLQGSITKLEKVLEQFEKYLNIKTLNINFLKGNMNKELYLYSNAIGSLIRGDSL